MNKIIITLSLICCIPFVGFAQSENKLQLSLEEAIEKGIENRFDIKADLYNVKLTENQITSYKKAWIPNLQAEGNAQYNKDLKPTVVPGEFTGSSEPSLLALGSKSTTTLGLSLEQPLFKPGINADIKIAKANRDLQQEKSRGTKTEIRNTIAQSYLNVLLKKLEYKIAQKEEKRFKNYKVLAEGKYNNGTLIKNNYLRTKLDYKNAKINTKKIKQDYDLSLENLKYQINIPTKIKLSLSDDINHISLIETTLKQDQAETNRTEIKQLKLLQQENKLEIKRARQNALPSISFVGYYAQLYQNDHFHYDESKWWAPQTFVGVKLSIPITENFRNKNNINAKHIKQDQLAMDLKQKKADVRYQVQKATNDVQDDLDNVEASKSNYELSQNIYENQIKQFDIGSFNYADLLETERSLSKAEQTYIESVYEYLKATLSYQKAIGEL